MYDPVSKRKIAQYALKQVGYEDGGKSVLDIGFGFGLVLLSLDRSDSVTGIELAESTVEQVRRRAEKIGFSSAEFHVYGGKGKFALPDSFFDLIICSHVLEHVPDDVFLIEEITRMLKPGGIAFLNVPINEEHFPDPRHSRKYSSGEFLCLIEKKRLRVVYSYHGDRLWSVIGWFFEKRYHKQIPVLGFVISSMINVLFSLWPFKIQIWFEERFLKKFKPRQFAVCARKYMS